jgi:acetyltransferase-like isoleucine patch superfamily enzyme
LLAGKHVFVEKPLARTVAEGEELVALAEQNGLVLMVGHTFLFSPAVRRMKEVIDSGDIGEIQYISARRLNLGLFQKDINVAWDLAPHDISIILHLLDEQPTSVSCQGSSHVNRHIEDVTMMYLTFKKNRCAFIQNSWLDPKKVRQMTVVGSRRMIVYDDTEPLEKLKIYDARVEVPAHYDSFAEFTYSYHYGDAYVPYIKQDEPLEARVPAFPRLYSWRSDSDYGRPGGLGGGPDFGSLQQLTETSRPGRRLGARGSCRSRWGKTSNGKANGHGGNGNARGACRNSECVSRVSATDQLYQRIAPDVKLGQRVKIFAFTNLYGCSVGDDTKIGTFVEIQKGARIGARCKVSSHTFVCEGVAIEDEVFIGHGVTFINDRFPRATNPDGNSRPKRIGSVMRRR